MKPKIYIVCALSYAINYTMLAKAQDLLPFHSILNQINSLQQIAIPNLHTSNSFSYLYQNDNSRLDMVINNAKNLLLLKNTSLALSTIEVGLQLSLGKNNVATHALLKQKTLANIEQENFENALNSCEQGMALFELDYNWKTACLFALAKTTTTSIGRIQQLSTLLMPKNHKNTTGVMAILNALALDKIGLTNQAISFLEQITTQNYVDSTWNSRIQLTNALLLLKVRQNNQAIPILQKLSQENLNIKENNEVDTPTKILAQLSLARLYRAQGKFELAKTQYLFALTNSNKNVSYPSFKPKLGDTLTEPVNIFSLYLAKLPNINTIKNEYLEFLCADKQDNQCMQDFLQLPPDDEILYASKLVIRSKTFRESPANPIAKILGVIDADLAFANQIANNNNQDFASLINSSYTLLFLADTYAFKIAILPQLLQSYAYNQQAQQVLSEQKENFNNALQPFLKSSVYGNNIKILIATAQQLSNNLVSAIVNSDTSLALNWNSMQGDFIFVNKQRELLITKIKLLNQQFLSNSTIITNTQYTDKYKSNIRQCKQDYINNQAHINATTFTAYTKGIKNPNKIENLNAINNKLLNKIQNLEQDANLQQLSNNFKNNQIIPLIVIYKELFDTINQLAKLQNNMQTNKNNGEINAQINYWQKSAKNLNNLMKNIFNSYEQNNNDYLIKINAIKQKIISAEKMQNTLQKDIYKELSSNINKAANDTYKEINNYKNQLKIAISDIDIEQIKQSQQNLDNAKLAYQGREKWLKSINHNKLREHNK